MEPLVEIDCDQWPELKELYRVDWPKNSVAYCALDTQISYPDFAATSKFRVFCPDGDINNGMVGISGEDGYYQVRIYPLNDIKKMEEALAMTKVINWNRTVVVPAGSPEVEECLKRLSGRLGIRIKGEKAFKHVLSRDSALIEDTSTPAGTYISEPKVEDLKLIDETWTYHGTHTYNLFEKLLRNHLLFVLYSKEGDPLAWLCVDDSGALTHLYCLEEHRRKGYAECVLKYVVNNELKKGKDLLAFTLEENIGPKLLFDKLNFERAGCDKWLILFKV